MVITSSTRNRVGGNTPRGFESHLLRQNKDPPSGWSLFFTPKVGFERRLLETCQWHVSTAVAFPQKRNPTAQISAPAPYGGMGGAECMRCLRNISAKKNSADRRNFPKGGSFSCCQKPKTKCGKVSIFTCFDNNFQRLKISQIFSQILLTKGDTPAIIYLVAERQAVHRERSMRVCWNW